MNAADESIISPLKVICVFQQCSYQEKKQRPEFLVAEIQKLVLEDFTNSEFTKVPELDKLEIAVSMLLWRG